MNIHATRAFWSTLVACSLEEASLFRYADGETTDREAAELYQHLQSCKVCAGRLAAINGMANELVGFFKAAPFDQALVEKTLRELPLLRPARRPKRLVAFLAMAAALLAALSFAVFHDGEVTQYVASVAGGGLLLESGGEGAPLEDGARLPQDSVLRNPTDHGIFVVFDDRSRVCLAPETRVRLGSSAGRGRVEILGQGTAFFDVSKRDSQFRVTAGELVVEVLGTRFSVESRPRATEVRLFQGKIRCVREDGTSLLLAAGEKLDANRWIKEPLEGVQGLKFYPLARELPLPVVSSTEPTLRPVSSTTLAGPQVPSTPAAGDSLSHGALPSQPVKPGLLDGPITPPNDHGESGETRVQ